MEQSEAASAAFPPLPASSKPSFSTANQSLLNDLKKTLPATRKRLAALHDPDQGAPTSDPDRMAQIIKTFWSKTWAKPDSVPPTSKILRYLASYPTRVPADLTPSIPSQDDIYDHILGTNNSAAGPDGIPFAIYRLCADTVAPLLHGIVVSLSKGFPPPAGFNHARLFLIPKNDSLDIEATRPISVTNSDNRIIAKTLTTAITPACQSFLDPSQKGFVAGRQSEEHILALNQAYYTALTRKQQHYILFLDTKKAFDSIHHEFILAVLDVLAMPQWFCFVVAGLLHSVQVFPVLASDTGVSIPILRGVKQGCPLSPLLFVMCYDVLLHKIDLAAPDPSHLTKHALADDLALSSSTLDPIATSLHVILLFAHYSGLGLNMNKTVILPTKPPSYADKCLLSEEGLSTIRFATSATYLGVLMGAKIKTVDIFAKAKAKFFDRLALFRPTLATLPLHKRILIFNIFLLPLLYYLAQFFVIPYHQMVVPIKLAAHRAIVAFNGGAFGYAQLIAPKAHMGPHTPLRDLWAQNIAFLAVKSRVLADSHGEHLPVMGPHTTVHRKSWGSLLIDAHRAHAAFSYLNIYCPCDAAKLLQVPQGTPASVRRAIYSDLSIWGYHQERSSHLARYKSSLTNKLKRHLSLTTTDAITAANNLCAHSALAAPLPPTIHNNFLRLVHNALPTDCRRSEAMTVPRRSPPGAPSPYPCYLCGDGEDSTHHLLNYCEVVKEALSRVSSDTNTNIPYNQPTLSLTFPPTSTPLPTIIVKHFGAAVWHQRQSHFSTLESPPPPATAVNRLTNYVLDQLLPSSPKNPTSTSAEIAALALSPPSHAITFFTDGSAIPNPGDAGAGVIGTAPPAQDGSPPFKCTLAASLGPGDNNTGEFYAIYAALRIAELCSAHYPPSDPTPPVIIISDSLLAISYILHGWKEKGNTSLARCTRALFKKLARRLNIRLYWVRGHSKVPGNEEADALAKTGAQANVAGDFTVTDPLLTLHLTAPLHTSMASSLPSKLRPDLS